MKKIRLEAASFEYANHSKARGLSPGTIRTQQSALRVFQNVVGNVPLSQVSHNDVDRVFSAHSWQQATRNTKIGQYRAFFRWAKARSYTDVDPMFGWRMLAPPEKDRARIPRAEWPKLFNACLHPQEEIVIAIGLYLFLRVSEMQALQLQHVHLSQSLIEVWRPKTKKWDTMPISAELDPYLRTWMTYLAELGFSDPGHYLVAARKRNLTMQGRFGAVAGSGTVDATKAFTQPSRVIRRVLTRAGYYAEQEGGHTLRRSGARAYFDELASNGYDGALRRVQSMLGHSHSMMTEVYLGLDLDRQQRNKELAGKPMFSQQEVRHLRGVNRQAL
jgi:integrase